MPSHKKPNRTDPNKTKAIGNLPAKPSTHAKMKPYCQLSQKDNLMSFYRHIRKRALGLLKHTPSLRQKTRHIYYAARSKQYSHIAKNTQCDERTVLFECFGGRQFGCSTRAIYERMLEDPRFADFSFVWSFKAAKLERFQDHPLLKGKSNFVIRESKEYFETCAHAKYWITNTRIAEYITPKEDQVYVQCWHGTPLKRLGYDVEIETQAALNTTEELAERFGIDAKKWTYLLSPSPYTSLHLADAFGLEQERRPSVILEKGYPRNDRIVRTCADADALAESINRFRAEHDIPSGKKLLLYAPTWRDDSYQAGKGYVMEDTLLDFDALKKAIGSEWVVLFRAHYYIANSFDFSPYEGFVYDVSKTEDINDLYIIADALLTDYSSVFFDYANTKRPMLFFWPDWEHYANDIRGFYFNLKELPGPQCYTTEEVASAILQINDYENRYGKEYQSFCKKFCPKDDGHAAERVIEAVFGNRL